MMYSNLFVINHNQQIYKCDDRQISVTQLSSIYSFIVNTDQTHIKHTSNTRI